MRKPALVISAPSSEEELKVWDNIPDLESITKISAPTPDKDTAQSILDKELEAIEPGKYGQALVHTHGFVERRVGRNSSRRNSKCY